MSNVLSEKQTKMKLEKYGFVEQGRDMLIDRSKLLDLGFQGTQIIPFSENIELVNKELPKPYRYYYLLKTAAGLRVQCWGTTINPYPQPGTQSGNI